MVERDNFFSRIPQIGEALPEIRTKRDAGPHA
jgi:hypothetical protein